MTVPPIVLGHPAQRAILVAALDNMARNIPDASENSLAVLQELAAARAAVIAAEVAPQPRPEPGPAAAIPASPDTTPPPPDTAADRAEAAKADAPLLPTDADAGSEAGEAPGPPEGAGA